MRITRHVIVSLVALGIYGMAGAAQAASVFGLCPTGVCQTQQSPAACPGGPGCLDRFPSAAACVGSNGVPPAARAGCPHNCRAYGSSVGAASRALTTVTFSMPYLESFKTTDPTSEDEIYVVLSGRSSSGGTFSVRAPGAGAHWNLNDGDGDPPVLNQDLHRFDMAEGSSVDFVVAVLEEDGGTVGGWGAVAGGLIGFLDMGAGSLVATLAEIFDIRDSDDYVGAVQVRLEMRNGQPLATFRALDRVTNSWNASTYWTRRPVSMNGDGSRYEAVFEVR